MKFPKRPQPRDSETLSDTIDSLLTACTVVLLLASLGGLAALFAGLHIGLRVGDILVFKPDATVADSLPVTAIRTAPLPQHFAAAAWWWRRSRSSSRCMACTGRGRIPAPEPAIAAPR